MIAPSAPPKVCGVGDHTFLLGRALASRARLRIHCGQGAPAPDLPDLDARVDFDSSRPRTLGPLSRSPEFSAGDGVLVQYTNFAFGSRGFNPWLAPAMARWRRKGLRITTIFHETYTDQKGPKGLAMRTWQRYFFWRVGLASHACLFSVEPWTRRYSAWFPRARVETLRVGSNIPVVPVDRSRLRGELGIGEGVPVLGVFGGTHPSRLFDWIERASSSLTSAGIRHVVLRIGPDSEVVARRLASAPLLDLGIREPAEVSRALGCCDVFLSPISDGASSRRGSLLAGLGHGLPVVTTLGPSSDATFREAGGAAFEVATGPEDFALRVAGLVADPGRRTELGAAARSFHDAHFSWDAIAERLLLLAG